MGKGVWAMHKNSNLLRKGGLKRPINLMTAFDQLFTTISYTLWLVILILVTTWEKPLAHTLGMTFCPLAQVIITYGVFYSFLAGAGTAFMRLKYVTTSFRGVEEFTLSLRIVAMTIIWVLVVTIIWDQAPKRTQSLISMCKGMAVNFIYLLWHRPTQSISLRCRKNRNMWACGKKYVLLCTL